VDKRTLLFFILLGLVLILWPLYSSWMNKGRVPVTPPEGEEVQPETSAVQEAPKVAEPVEAALPETLRFAPVGGEVPERIITVDTDLYTAKFSGRGARLISFSLKRYQRAADGPVEMIPPERSSGALSLGILELDLLPFTADVDSLSLDSRNKLGNLKFTFADSLGRSLVKEFSFSNDTYSLNLTISCDDPSYFGLDKDYQLTWGGPPPLTEKNIGEDLGQTKAYASFGGELLDFKKFKDGELKEERTGSTSWVALRSKYFAAAVAPKSRSGEGFSVFGREVPTVIEEDNYKLREIGVSITLPIEGDSISDRFLIYIGPLDYHILKGYGLGLENLVELGWKIIKPFSIFVLWILAFLHKFFPNYGLVIIIFSILIKVLFHPLTRKSVKSMASMQELQPKLARLKEKYKKDPKRLNEETMKLYKEQGVYHRATERSLCVLDYGSFSDGPVLRAADLDGLDDVHPAEDIDQRPQTENDGLHDAGDFHFLLLSNARRLGFILDDVQRPLRCRTALHQKQAPSCHRPGDNRQVADSKQ